MFCVPRSCLVKRRFRLSAICYISHSCILSASGGIAALQILVMCMSCCLMSARLDLAIDRSINSDFRWTEERTQNCIYSCRNWMDYDPLEWAITTLHVYESGAYRNKAACLCMFPLEQREPNCLRSAIQTSESLKKLVFHNVLR
jgi:hypothetical protein